MDTFALSVVDNFDYKITAYIEIGSISSDSSLINQNHQLQKERMYLH